MEFVGSVELPTTVLEPATNAIESLSEVPTNPGQEVATSRFHEEFDDGVETQTAMQLVDVMPERRSDPPARRREPSDPPQRAKQDSVTMIRAEESAPRAIGKLNHRPPSPNDNLPTMDGPRPAFMSPPPPPPPPPAPPAPPAPAMMQPSVVTSLPKAPPAIIGDGPRAEPELEVGFVEVSNAGAFIDEYRGSVASPMPAPAPIPAPVVAQHLSRFSRLQQQSAPPPGTPLQGIPRPRPIATVDALPQAHQWGQQQRESYRSAPPPRAAVSPPPTAGIPHFRTPPQALPMGRDFRSGVATASQSQSQSLTQSRFKPMAVAWFVVGMAVGMVAMFFIFGRAAAPVEPEPTAGATPPTSAAPVQSAPVAQVAPPTTGNLPTSAFGAPQFGPGPAGLPTQPAPVAYPMPGTQQPGTQQQPGMPQPGMPQPGMQQPGAAPQPYALPFGAPQQPAPQPPQYQAPSQPTFAPPQQQPPQYQQQPAPQTTPYNALPPAPVAQPAPRPAPQAQYRPPAPAPAPRPRPPPRADADDPPAAPPSSPTKSVDSAADVLKDAL